MKKFYSLFLIALMGLFVVSCTTDDDRDYTDYDTYPVMKDISGTLSASNGYTINQSINIQASDVVLVYRNTGTTAAPIWQLLPKTYFLDGGRELDYNFLFNRTAIEIYSEANFDQATMTTAERDEYLSNQQFRVVLVPASQASADIDFSNYGAVERALKLNQKIVN